MQRHWWATEALWVGLVAPSETAWGVGSKALEVTDLTALPGAPDNDAARSGARALQEAATAAVRADTPEARGQAYGRIVTTCAACHVALARGPGLSGEGPDPLE